MSKEILHTNGSSLLAWSNRVANDVVGNAFRKAIEIEGQRRPGRGPTLSRGASPTPAGQGVFQPTVLSQWTGHL